jgi:hypothetical protein
MYDRYCETSTFAARAMARGEGDGVDQEEELRVCSGAT